MDEAKVKLSAPLLGWETSPGYVVVLLGPGPQAPGKVPVMFDASGEGRPFSLRKLSWERSEKPNERRYFYVRDDLSPEETQVGLAEHWTKASPVPD